MDVRGMITIEAAEDAGKQYMRWCRAESIHWRSTKRLDFMITLLPRVPS
jgi:hypothetical protein